MKVIESSSLEKESLLSIPRPGHARRGLPVASLLYRAERDRHPSLCEKPRVPPAQRCEWKHRMTVTAWASRFLGPLLGVACLSVGWAQALNCDLGGYKTGA